MSVFIRRFTFDPGLEVFLEIEAVNILDLEPPASISGVGTGTALLVAEFDDGPFEEVTEVTSAVDLAKQFGGFGYTYAGVVSQNPCCRARKADGALTPEYWNGAGIIHLNGKKFSRLLLCRVDTSVGKVNFNRCAWLPGGALFSYALATGQTLLFTHGVSSVTATFTGTKALLTSGVGVYPSTFTGGENLVFKIEGVTYTAVFTAADQTQTQVVARLNAAAGYAAFADVGGGVTTFTGLVGGTLGAIEIVSGTASVLTATGFAAAVATGSGNVGNIAAVSPAEVDAVVSAASMGAVRVLQLDSGAMRLENRGTPLTGTLMVTGGTAAATLGFAVSQNAAWQDLPTEITVTQVDPAVTAAVGISLGSGSVLLTAAGAYPTGFVGGEKFTLQVGSNPPKQIVFTSADQSQAQVIDRINLVLGYAAAVAQSATHTAIAGPGTNDTVIPAGTMVGTTSGDEWVTMQTTTVAADVAGPYSIKVRPANDNGSAAAAAVLAVDTLPRPVASSAWKVQNPLALSAALSEAAIDAKYLSAFDATLDANSVAAQANLIWSARQSNATRAKARENAIEAGAAGLLARVTAIRPPLGTTRAVAKSNAAQPGVGAYRNQRVVYCYPAVQTFVPAIAAAGVSGGEGFTKDGIIDLGSDGFLIGVCSRLPPEQNPGQLTDYMGGAIGIERNNPDVQKLSINDYKAFRSSGICAPRPDSGTMVFQSGVTSVDPGVQPNLRNIARRRMADFIQDSIARRLKAYGKKLSTRTARAGIVSEIRAFATQLLSPGNAAAQRIDGFSLDPVSGNTPETLALGVFRIILNVRTLASLDAIVLQSTVGEGVDVTENAALQETRRPWHPTICAFVAKK